MAASKIPTATTIPLEPVENEQFFAVVIPEQNLRWKSNGLWIFKVGCGAALMASSHRGDTKFGMVSFHRSNTQHKPTEDPIPGILRFSEAIILQPLDPLRPAR